MHQTWQIDRLSGLPKIAGSYIRSCFTWPSDVTAQRSGGATIDAPLHWAMSAHFDILNAKADKLDAKSLAVMEGYDIRPMLFVGGAKSFRELRNWLADQGQRIDHHACLGEAVDDLISNGDRWSFVIVDVDDFGGIAAAVDALLLLRKASGDRPVILISAEVAADDLTAERLVLCDATLRLPLTVTRFELGVAEATINNGVWHDRRFQLGLSDYERAL